jgi:hypothetical protein
MCALTEHQPYADLIMAGVKDVVNRTRPVPSTLPTAGCDVCGDSLHYGPDRDGIDRCQRCGGFPTPFPFRLGIHAAATPATDLPPWLNEVTSQLGHTLLPRWNQGGVLLGFVTVTGQHHADECMYPRLRRGDHYIEGYCSRWALPDRWHYTLTDPEPLDAPVPMKGQPGFWRLPETK